jgi:5-methylcytosine-specific restriction endonuclease McrA
MVLLEPRRRKRACTLAAVPDRRCSPGAYASRLTKAVVCSSSFHTRQIRRIPRSEKFAVEREYGLPAGRYRQALEIDHIVPLRLGGSNNIANLFPEEYAFANRSPGYVVKDRLDSRLHALVCAGRMNLRSAQRRIAANWKKLYGEMFGRAAGHARG